MPLLGLLKNRQSGDGGVELTVFFEGRLGPVFGSASIDTVFESDRIAGQTQVVVTLASRGAPN